MPAPSIPASDPSPDHVGDPPQWHTARLNHAVTLAVTVVAVLVLVAAAVVRVRLATLPLERDEGEYAYIGQRLLLGEAPFVGSYTMKFPGVALIDAIAFVLFGDNVLAVRMALLALNVVAVAGLAQVVRRALGPLPALVAAAVCATALVNIGVQGLFAHATHAVVAFVVVGANLLVRGLQRKHLGLVLAAGVAFGTAVVMKQHAALFIPGALLVIWRSDLERQRLPRAISAFLAGVALAVLVVVVWLSLHGAFSACWFWTVTQARAYISLSSTSSGITHLLKAVRYMAPTMWSLWLLAGAGFGVVVVRHPRERSSLPLLVVGALLSFLATCPGLFFRPHYFVVVAPMLGVCAALFTARLASLSSTMRTVAGGFIVVALLAPWIAQRHMLTTPVAVLARAVDGDGTFSAAIVMAEAVQANSADNGTLAVFGSEPELLFLSQRRSATGYLYMYPLMEPHPHAGDMQQQLVDEVSAAAPQHVVVVVTPLSWLQRRESPTLLHTWLDRWLADRYELVGVIDLEHVDAGIVEPPAQAPQRFMAHYVRQR